MMFFVSSFDGFHLYFQFDGIHASILGVQKHTGWEKYYTLPRLYGKAFYRTVILLFLSRGVSKPDLPTSHEKHGTILIYKGNQVGNDLEVLPLKGDRH